MYDNTKSHKKKAFTFSLEDYFLENDSGIKLTPHLFFLGLESSINDLEIGKLKTTFVANVVEK